MYGEVGVITFVLLVVAVAMEVLLEGLIDVFSLAIAFRMVTEVELHVEGFPETMEEMRDKFGASVGSDVEWDSVLGKDIHYKEVSELDCREGIVGWYENTLF